MITLRFVTSKGIAADLIARGQLGVRFPTHVEWRMDNGSLLGAHLDGGVMIRPQGYDDATLETEHYVNVPCTDQQRADFVAFLTGQLGKPYDATAIAALAAGALTGIERDWRSPDSWFCSEVDCTGFEQAHIIPALPVAAQIVTPMLFYCLCAMITPDFGTPTHRS
jgi:hypothetical protein